MQFCQPLTEARIAIVHYWIVGLAGGEKVVQQLLQLYPQADVFTLISDPMVSTEVVGDHRLTVSFLQKLPGVIRHYRKLLPLMPMALEALDLRGYDLIISSESGPAKGIIPPLDALHICYCHSPMRYLWDQAHDYRAETGRLTSTMMTVLGPRLRQWDWQGAQRVDHIIANSNHVAKRIRRYWQREAAVIHPPVDVDRFLPRTGSKDYYLITGRHVGYKRIDLAIAMANKTNRSLLIAGSGPETKRLQKLAGPTVTLLGQVSNAQLADLYAGARAFLMPGEEDFGIAPIEAMSAGVPVIAFGRGGALDSVLSGVSGILFEEQTDVALAKALDAFEKTSFDAAAIRTHAQRFSADRFRAEMGDYIEKCWNTHHADHSQ